MAKFKIVARVEGEEGTAVIVHDMEQDELTATHSIRVGCLEIAEARASVFNRQRQHGKAALKQIGSKGVPNHFVRFA